MNDKELSKIALEVAEEVTNLRLDTCEHHIEFARRLVERLAASVAMEPIGYVDRSLIAGECAGTMAYRKKCVESQVGIYSHEQMAQAIADSDKVCDSYAKENQRLSDEIDALKDRLELSPDHGWDGIACRDETIRLLTAERNQWKAQAVENLQIAGEAMGKLGALEAERDALKLDVRAATHMVNIAWHAFSKLKREGHFMPHAEVDWWMEIHDKVSQWLVSRGSVGIDFSAGASAIDAAMATITKEKS